MASSSNATTWREFIRQALIEQGPVDKNLFVWSMALRMPSGYAWYRYVVDGKKVRTGLARLGLTAEEYREEFGREYWPEPETVDDVQRSKEALVKWFLRQFKAKDPRYVERDGKISYEQ